MLELGQLRPYTGQEEEQQMERWCQVGRMLTVWWATSLKGSRMLSN